MKLTKALLVLALAVALAAPVYAETQNVKVSGSIDAYWFYRHNYDLLDNNDSGAVAFGTAAQGDSHGGSAAHRSEGDDYAMTITQLQVAADLTDNVSTVINLINQRDWNADVFETAAANATQEFDVMIDLAHVQMKEIFYAPLTLTIGRQDIVFGRGFVIGWNPQDPSATIQADEFTQIQSFDAIRATLDFNPWAVDFVWSNVNENSHDPEDDQQLYLTNVNYKFSEYNAVAEGYLFADLNKAAIAGATGTRNNTTYTVGGRAQFDPISKVTLGGELAYQFGNYISSLAAGAERDRQAVGLDLFGEYRFETNWKPMVGLEYVFLSGESETGASTDSYSAWNGAFRLPVYGWIRDYQEVYYTTAQASDAIAGQNQQHISLYGSLNPMEDLKLALNYFRFWTDEDVLRDTANPGAGSYSSHIGDEIDTLLTYAYTEDVTFNFMANWFIPGSHYQSPTDATASEYVSEVKVVF